MRFENSLVFLEEVKKINSELLLYVKDATTSKHHDFQLMIFQEEIQNFFVYIFLPFSDSENIVVFFGDKYAFSEPITEQIKLIIKQKDVKGLIQYAQRRL